MDQELNEIRDDNYRKDLEAKKNAIDLLFYRVIDPINPINDWPAISTILYGICDNNHKKLDESIRVIRLFMEAAYDAGKEINSRTS